MRQFPLDELDIAPGRVIEWRVCSTWEGDAGAAGEGRKSASFNQDKHFSVIEEARKANELIASWLAVTFEVRGRFDQEAMEAALLYFTRRHEVLRCEFRRLAGDLSCDPVAAAHVGLEAVDKGDFGSAEELRAFLAGSFRENTDTLSWPLFVMGAVVRDGGPSTVYLAFDHIVSDGVSMPNVVHDIQTAYAAFVQGRKVVLPAAGSYLDFGQEQRNRYLSIDADDARLGYWKGFMARNGGFFPRFPLDLGVEPDRMYPTVNEAHRLLDVWETTALEARCREAGGSVFMGVLTAGAVALRVQGGPGVYRGFMPVSERGRGLWTHSMGWFVNTLPIEFPVTGELDFADVMGGARAGFTTMLRNADVPFVRAWELLAPQSFARGSWPFPVNFFSYMDMRRSPGAEHHPAWRPTAHVWTSCANGTCSWFQRDVMGLHVNSIYIDTPEARLTMTAVRESLRHTLRVVADTGSLPREMAMAASAQGG